MNLKEIEEDVEKKSIRRGLAIGLGIFFGILMLVSLTKAGQGMHPIWNSICGVANGLIMVGFIAASQSRR